MSAESAVASLLSTLKAMSTSYRAQAKALVQEADDRLSALETPEMDGVTFDVTRPTPDLTRVPRPPTIKGIGELNLPEMQALQDVSQIEDRFTDDAPVLYGLPDFQYGTLADAPEFTATAPTLGAMPAEPTIPDLTEPTIPDLTAPTWIAAPDSVEAVVPNLTAPTAIPDFTENIFTRYREYLALAGPETEEFLAYLNGLRDDLAPSAALLSGHLRTALQGAGFWPDAWEQRTFEQAQQSIMTERHSAIGALDSQPSSQTGLPSGASVAARLSLELKTLVAIAEAAGKTADERQEREAKHIQWAMEIALKLVDAALELKAQAAGWTLKMLALALDGADATLDLAIRVLDFKRKEVALVSRYNKALVARYEIQMKAEHTKVEALRLEVANNKLIQQYDENQIAAYEATIAFLDANIRLYAARVEYVGLDVAYRKLALEQYEAEVSAYRANAKARMADHAAVKATIAGDKALADAEWAKVRLFEAELAGELANARAKSATAAAQAAQAKSVLGEYTATLDAQLSYLRTIDASVKTAMSALVKGFAAEAAEQELKISDQEVEDAETISDALDELRTEQIELTTALQAHQVTLGQLAAQSKIIDGGASTLSGIASAAFQGLNGIAVTELAEEA